MQISKLFVFVDYSPCARGAYQAALQLASKLGASVELIHVWTAPYFGPQYEDLPVGPEKKSLFSLIRERAGEEMAEFQRGVSVPAGVAVHARVESGETLGKILDLIREEQPDLVVIGTHGRTGAKRLLLGSVAERIVQLSPAPVLTIPLK